MIHPSRKFLISDATQETPCTNCASRPLHALVLMHLVRIAALLLLLAAARLPAAPSPALLLEDGFERSDLLHGGWWKHSGNADGRTTHVVSREGGQAAVFTVHIAKAGDFRSEITAGPASPAPRSFEIGETYWYGVSIMPCQTLSKSPFPEAVFQFHSTPDGVPGETWSSGLNPPVALYCDGARWTLTVRGDSRPITQKGNYEFSRTKIDLGAAVPGKWADWVFQIRWRSDIEGILRVWRDQELVYEGRHPNCYNDTVGPYLKLGVYASYLRSDRETRAEAIKAGLGDRVYYFDALRIGGETASFDDVAPKPIRQDGALTSP
jgi:hypothetical protein